MCMVLSVGVIRPMSADAHEECARWVSFPGAVVAAAVVGSLW